MVEELLRSGAITELPGASNVAYVLNDSRLFLLTGYKVLKSQEKNIFVRCTRLLYNGKTKLYYFTSGYKSLNHLLPSLNEDSFLIFAANLLSAVIEIKNNGFLSCENLVLSMDRIYVNPSTLTVSLIYLPLTFNTGDVTLIENQLRSRMIKLIRTTPFLMTRRMQQVCQELASSELSLENVYQELCGQKPISPLEAKSSGKEEKKQGQASGTEPAPELDQDAARKLKLQPEMLFQSLNAPTPICFKINKPEFIIGKLVSAVDGPLTFSNAISRIHCKIIYDQGAYYIVDLGSVNGTYVNKARLVKDSPCLLKDQDRVRLAKFDFSVQIRI